jgi:hypothetical protein
MGNFFKDMQTQLLNYAKELDDTSEPAEFKPNEKQTNKWFKNEYLKQKDQVQNDKITQRKQKIEVYDNEHVPMNREQLGVNNNFNVPVAQDTLNPNLENITSRFINIDSQFRQASTGTESSSTNYTLDLSEPLNNVLSLRLYSTQIPYAWYTIDVAYGNTCFWIVFNEDYTNNVQISVEPGNYTPQEFVNQLNFGLDGSSNFSDPLFKFPKPITANYPVSFNPNNGKITMNLQKSMYNQQPIISIDDVNYDINTSLTMTNITKIVFFDVDARLNCGTSYCNPTNTINQTMGWVMGYRLPYVYVEANGNVAVTLIDLFGPKYLILVIDDFNQNHINNGLITITELSTNIKLPSYYNSTFPVTCTPPGQNNLDSNIGIIQEMQSNNANSTQGGYNGDLLMEKLNITYKTIPKVLPTAPRILTQAQLYSINQIIQNNERNTNYRSKAPTSSDTFALIPLKHGGFNTGDMYVEFSGSLQDNKRIYFGPVNIDRLRIQLLDDKGNNVNMNGADWSFTIIAEILYQY